MSFKKVLACALLSGAALAQNGPTIGGCPVFPANNIWNTPVDKLPVHRLSTTYVNAIGASAVFRLDDALPINIVPATQPEVPVKILAEEESDHGGYAIPPNPKIELGSDGHVLVVRQGDCILYELISATPSTEAPGGWDAYSAAKWDLNSNALRPYGWTSADAAGLAMVPGVLRYDEVAEGEVKHALRFTAPNTPYSYFVWPARHYASHKQGDLPPFGTRVRLKAGFNVAPYSPRLQVIMRGLKKYGAILADNGLPWAHQHDGDPRWDAEELVSLHFILKGSDFEVVDTSSLMFDEDSGQVAPATRGVVVTDFFGRKQAVALGPGLAISNGVLTASGGGGGGPVASVAGRTGDVRLSVGDIDGLSAALNGKEQALTFTPPLARNGNTVSCPSCTSGGSAVAPPGGGGSSSGAATFARTDTTTMGTWKGAYGQAGYNVAGDSFSYPGYVAVRITADPAPVVWAPITADVRALQFASRPLIISPEGLQDRIAAAWTSASSVAVEVNFADSDSHNVGLYFLDWDAGNRVVKVEALDVNNRVLDSRTVSSFSNGQYLFWRVTGHVTFRVTGQIGTPVVSGLFFDR